MVGVEDIYAKYRSMGIDKSTIQYMMYMCTVYDHQLMFDDIDFFLDRYRDMMKMKYTSRGNSYEDMMIDQAIRESIDGGEKTGSYEPLSIEERIRRDGEPVCLKNIGNTCYFNSLIQTLFRTNTFVRDMMAMTDIDGLKKYINDGDTDRTKKVRSIDMVHNIQKIFIGMITSSLKYLDPTQVISNCVTDRGEQFKIGEQLDIIEYMVNFIDRICDVICIYNDVHNSVYIDDIGCRRGYMGAEEGARVENEEKI